MSNFLFHKHSQCFTNETNFYASKSERTYPLLPLAIIIFCANLIIGILLINRVFRNRNSNDNIYHLELIQTSAPQKHSFISFSSPPALLWSKSEQVAKTLTAKNLELIALSDDSTEGERITDYVPGGYMQCELGQHIGAEKEYSILRKLGWGHFSTVWLCEKKETKEYRAIKIVKSDDMFSSVAYDEIRLLEDIRTTNPNHDGFKRIITLKDHFLEENHFTGIHVCLVFEVMGPSVWELLAEQGFGGFDQPSVKAIIKQLLVALTYLHQECHIIHTDIKPENILIVVKDSYIQEMVDYTNSYKKLGVQMPKSYISTLDWKDNLDVYGNRSGSNRFVSLISNGTATHDDSVISTCRTTIQDYTKPRFSFPVFVDRNVQIKLADLGNACKEEKHYAHVIQTVQYRALEVILEAGYSYPADMWSVACVAFELSTGEYLFGPQDTKQLSLVQDHLGLIWEVLNGIPEYVAKSGKLSQLYFDSKGYLKYISTTNLKIWKVEDVLVDKYKWRRVEAILLGNFIQSLIEPDPTLRASCSDALELPWLKE